ncbi:DNA-binding transcriptional regulator BolA isoform X4 [Ceratina calcarata]|uniref:DNA-binding transcriptional regulator BolA isoform X4 n=1 Tax=Ceratina calcarata TaxID=156304 RepID=A0AAJ7WCF9_9HYME|nr:DNA-binding transcriptional regulator BolA isoform X4 [Ceratina calcarata]
MFKVRRLLKNKGSLGNLMLQKMSSNAVSNPIENSMKKKLEESLNPLVLQIINESYMHNVPSGSETHFKIVVVSELFEDKSLIKRHRMINQLLESELQNGVHALSIIHLLLFSPLFLLYTT